MLTNGLVIAKNTETLQHVEMNVMKCMSIKVSKEVTFQINDTWNLNIYTCYQLSKCVFKTFNSSDSNLANCALKVPI